jgi:malate dehydrogenase (oxaloacetate-decarboxylating)(NADP+)
MYSNGTRKGYDLLRDPRFNKGNAFTLEERDRYALRGLLPNVVETLETQVARIEEQCDLFDKPINKYIYLMQLQDSNQTLYFRTLMNKPAKYLPIVYTPTVGEACEKFGHLLRRPRGLYIPVTDRGRIRDILHNWPEQDVRFAVVTDGERILGLGDLGVCGMGIPIGKLALYTTCAGVDPNYTLPIMLDVGTNNETFLKDPLYPGLRMKRLRGQEYTSFIDEFVDAINEVYPHICIQWEDFAGPNAVSLLARYRDKICTFNDDIQGTAAVALGGLFGAVKATGKPMTEQRFFFFGAGSAATGIAGLIVQVLRDSGMTEEEALSHCWMFNSGGLLVSSRTDLDSYKARFAHEHAPVSDLLTAIEELKPTALIGVSTIGGAFTQPVIEAMARMNSRPIIFPFSNPTSHSECTAEQAYSWTDGRAIFASGSPFNPVDVDGRTFTPSQGNNVYIFPAMGLAVLATKAKHVTDEMFIRAAEALAAQVTDEMMQTGLIYPPIDDILDVSINVAIEVARFVFDSGLATVERPENIAQFVRSKVYHADYESLKLPELAPLMNGARNGKKVAV